MACYRQWGGYQGPNGKVTIGHTVKNPDSKYLNLPCGRCFGCLAERRQQWALRAQHEASTWLHNYFVTLTYNDESLPWHGGLQKRHLQLFLKRLRKKRHGEQTSPRGDKPIRYFACGEYGEKTKRAHYHALLFNLRLDDLQPYGEKTWTSPTVTELWPYGTHLIGTVTPASAAYVAGYQTKKIYGTINQARIYGRVNPVTGEYLQIEKDFMTCSLRPGIGQYWYDRHRGDLRNGYLVHDGTKHAIPRFYEQKYQNDYPEEQPQRDLNRERRSIQKTRNDPERKTDARLTAAETNARAKRTLTATTHLQEG